MVSQPAYKNLGLEDSSLIPGLEPGSPECGPASQMIPDLYAKLVLDWEEAGLVRKGPEQSN